jgi:hypothetical protein
MDYYQFYISDGFTGTGMDRYNTKGWRNRVHRYPMRSSTIGSSTIKGRIVIGRRKAENPKKKKEKAKARNMPRRKTIQC